MSKAQPETLRLVNLLLYEHDTESNSVLLETSKLVMELLLHLIFISAVFLEISKLVKLLLSQFKYVSAVFWVKSTLVNSLR